MEMPGRKFTAGSGYRYGFNGKEKDNDITNDKYDYGARIYDARVGKWLSRDIMPKAFITPYNYSSNNPVNYLDPNGEDNIHFYYAVVRQYIGGKYISAKTTKFSVVEKNNEPNVFIHHKVELRYDGIGANPSVTKQIDTRFYPDVPGEAIGLTKSYLGLVKDDDRKTLIKFIDEYGLSKQDVDAGNYTEIRQSGSSKSDRMKKADWWSNVFKEKKFKEDEEKKEMAGSGLALTVLSIVAPELIIARIGLAVRAGNLVKIAAIDGDVMMFSAKIGSETVEGISNFAVKDGKLFLNKLHLEGSSAGKVGRESLWDMAKDLGRQYNVKEVVIQGGKRTTGKYKGKVPSPITIKVD